MEIKVTEKVLETINSSLIASKASLKAQLSKATSETKKAIIAHQLKDVEEALKIFSIWG